MKLLARLLHDFDQWLLCRLMYIIYSLGLTLPIVCLANCLVWSRLRSTSFVSPTKRKKEIEIQKERGKKVQTCTLNGGHNFVLGELLDLVEAEVELLRQSQTRNFQLKALHSEGKPSSQGK